LLTNEGALLATIGEYGKIVSAIYANIWTSFEKSGNLEYLLSDCEEGKVLVTKVTNQFLLCMYGDQTTEFGMLKQKAKLLKEYLEVPLKQVME
jgi:predicted regulator of Ras-like GTPase activity (Roadblock/LC7/MglB family)